MVFSIVFDLARPFVPVFGAVGVAVAAPVTFVFALTKGLARVFLKSAHGAYKFTNSARVKTLSGSWMAPVNDVLLGLMSEKLYRTSYEPMVGDYLATQVQKFNDGIIPHHNLVVSEWRKSLWIAQTYIGRVIEAARGLISLR